MHVRTAVLAVATAAALAAPTVSAAPTALKIDVDHSNVSFSVRHLFTRVHGRFREFSGSLVFDPDDLAASRVTATIRAASVDTDVAARDKDLRSKRFFDAEAYPTLTFVGKSVTAVSATKFEILGTLTMHGVSKDVTLDAEFLGKGKDPWGNLRYGFHATTTVNRKDFGMHWNEALETGGVLVGDDVAISLDIEAVPEG